MNKIRTQEGKNVYYRRLMEDSRGSISPVFISRERPKTEESIKADLIYESALWLEGGRGA